jgi:hypothetical protein
VRRIRLVLVVSATAVLVAPPIVGASAHPSSTPPACPPAQPVSTLVSERPGAAEELVPPGATALRLCSYQNPSSISTSKSGDVDPIRPASTTRALKRALVTSQAELRWFVQTFNELRSYPSGKAISCPADLGTKALALFSYAASPGDPVTIELTGCTAASNGHITRWASSEVLDRITHLLG